MEAIQKAQESGHRGLQEIRHSVSALRDSPLYGRSLMEALQEMAATINTSGLRVEVQTKGEVRPLPSLVESTLFRCAQEGLTNASRHARATRVEVCVDFTVSDVVRLSVVDDGPGFSPFDALPGHGLRGLHERAQALHGSFMSGTASSGGGLCQISIPA
jgi:signal transduction histidine kinase